MNWVSIALLPLVLAAGCGADARNFLKKKKTGPDTSTDAGASGGTVVSGGGGGTRDCRLTAGNNSNPGLHVAISPACLVNVASCPDAPLLIPPKAAGCPAFYPNAAPGAGGYGGYALSAAKLAEVLPADRQGWVRTGEGAAIDPVLKPLIDTYEQTLVDHGLPQKFRETTGPLVEAVFVDTQAESGVGGAIGVCSGFMTQKAGNDPVEYWNAIYIDQSLKSAVPGTQEYLYLTAVVYHELTHCLLNRPHSHIEGTIMARDAPVPADAADLQRLIDQLFSPDYQASLLEYPDPRAI